MRPLSGIVVVDLSIGMAGAMVSKLLSDWGARVVRVAPAQGDPWESVYPAYRFWRFGQEVDDLAAVDDARLGRLLDGADICIGGGEDHPAVSREDRLQSIEVLPKRLIHLYIEGYPAGHPLEHQPATDLLVQARSGLAYEQYEDRPCVQAFRPAIYGAAIHGLIGLLSALIERESSGQGQRVATSLLEGALAWTQSVAATATRPSPAFEFTVPKNPRPLVLRCADGAYVHIVLGSKGSKFALYQVLGIDDASITPEDAGLPSPKDPPEKFFGDVALLSEYVGLRESEALLQALLAAGVIAERCYPPGECWDDPQIEHNEIIRTDASGARFVGDPVIFQPVDATAARASVKEVSRLKVVDFGSFVAGPGATIPFVDLGADVVKVEPIGGDPNRSVFRSFSSVNRGKRSIALDIKHPIGREIALRLVRDADVVTSNLRPGPARRLGLDAETLHAMTPGQVVLQTTGFGLDGPYSERPAFDPILQAFTGLEVRSGGAGNLPLWNRFSSVDYATAFLGGAAALLGLFHRGRTGRGCLVQVPLVHAGILTLAEIVQGADGAWVGERVQNAEQTGFRPTECLYEARDGWIAIAALSEESIRGLAEVLGASDLLSKPAHDWGSEESSLIASLIKERDRDEVSSALREVGVWVEPCMKAEQTRWMADQSLIGAGTIHRSEVSDFGTVSEVGVLFRLSRSGRGGHGVAPRVGQHTRDILFELGYSPDQIEQFYDQEVVA